MHGFKSHNWCLSVATTFCSETLTATFGVEFRARRDRQTRLRRNIYMAYTIIIVIGFHTGQLEYKMGQLTFLSRAEQNWQFISTYLNPSFEGAKIREDLKPLKIGEKRLRCQQKPHLTKYLLLFLHEMAEILTQRLRNILQALANRPDILQNICILCCLCAS